MAPRSAAAGTSCGGEARAWRQRADVILSAHGARDEGSAGADLRRGDERRRANLLGPVAARADPGARRGRDPRSRRAGSAPARGALQDHWRRCGCALRVRPGRLGEADRGLRPRARRGRAQGDVRGLHGARGRVRHDGGPDPGAIRELAAARHVHAPRSGRRSRLVPVVVRERLPTGVAHRRLRLFAPPDRRRVHRHEHQPRVWRGAVQRRGARARARLRPGVGVAGARAPCPASASATGSRSAGPRSPHAPARCSTGCSAAPPTRKSPPISASARTRSGNT